MHDSNFRRDAFIDAYTKALLASWSSDEYAARLESDPRAALAEVGLELPADAVIQVIRGGSDPGGTEPESRLEGQIALYELGLSTGTFEFHIPATPQIDASELDVDELTAIAAGAADIDIYCCCCPCCCCG